MENGLADFVKAALLPSCFLLGGYGLPMKGGVLKDDDEIALVNLSY